MDEMTISVGDMIAVLARKGKQIICCGIVFAILLGGLKGFSVWKNLNDEEYVNLDQITYEQNMLSLEKSIERANRSIANQENYIANSLWMKLNPYDKHVTEVYLVISGMDETSVSMTFGDATTPMDYLLGRILDQYALFWNAEDFPKALGLPKYEDVLDKYLRELVRMDFMGGGVIKVTALGETASDARILANAAADFLLKKSSDVKKNSFDHTLSIFNTVQQNQIDSSMAEIQYDHYAQIDGYAMDIVDTQKVMSELAPPESAAVSIIKMIVVGGIAGAALACAWYLGKMLFMGGVQSSAHMERSASIPFAGTLAKKRGFFCWVADLFSGERVWKDESMAMDYIVEMVKLRFVGKQLLLVSTLNLEADKEAVEKLRGAFSAANIQTSFEGNAAYNPNVPSAMKGCDGVLLLERVDCTRIEQVSKTCSLAEECEKPVVGFVLV